MKKNLLYSAFCLFSFSSLLPLCGEVFQYENHLVKTIEIISHDSEGCRSLKKTLLTQLKTKEGSSFSQIAFDDDLKVLAKEYDRVEPSISLDEEDLAVKIDVWPKSVIFSIKWKGNCQVKTADLQKELDIKCFSDFDSQSFCEAFRKIKAYYIKNGYFEAEVDYEISKNEETNEVEITILIEEGRSGKIEKIIFNKFTEEEERHILKEMITKEFNRFLSWYTNEGTYNQEAAEQDRATIISFLQNEGFADANVSIDIRGGCKKNRIVLTLTLDRGELYTFGTVSFDGNKLFDDCVIDPMIRTRPNLPFSLDAVRETVNAITEAYGRKGYIDVLVDYDVVPGSCEREYDIAFKIEEGEQYRVGLVRVFGNLITKTSVILHETLMIPGEIFNTRKLKATEERLKNIGYFKNVNVYIVKGTDSTLSSGYYRDVYIEVEEGQTGNFGAALGYSSVEDVFVNFSLTERNFNHEGITKIASQGLEALRGGGEYFQLNLEFGQKSREYGISWTKPYFFDTKWAVGFDLTDSTSRYISEKYDLDVVSLVLRGNYDINQFWHFGVQYRLSNGHTSLQHHGDEVKGLEHDANIDGLISGIGASLYFDSTNHPVKPSKGFRSKLAVEYVGLGGDHHYMNLAYANTYYFPIGSRSVLKYKADFRFIQPLGHTHFHTIPLDERIYLGGEYMVRGFRPYRLGPHYSHDPSTPMGGISLQFYSVELCRRIIEDCELFAFLDAGHLSNKKWNFGRLSTAIGFGARVKLIPSVPQLTLGMGYPLNPQNHSEVKKFFFSFGGNF